MHYEYIPEKTSRLLIIVNRDDKPQSYAASSFLYTSGLFYISYQ